MLKTHLHYIADMATIRLNAPMIESGLTDNENNNVIKEKARDYNAIT